MANADQTKFGPSPTIPRRLPLKTPSSRWSAPASLLTRVILVFNCVTSANTNDALQKAQEYEAPRLAAHQDAIYLNSRLFARVKAVYEQRASLHLNPESLRLVEYDYQQFVKGGR